MKKIEYRIPLLNIQDTLTDINTNPKYLELVRFLKNVSEKENTTYQIELQLERRWYPEIITPSRWLAYEVTRKFGLVFEDWKKELPYVDIIASGYDWTCPECDTDNHEIETAENVTCKDCQNQFRVREIYHADP